MDSIILSSCPDNSQACTLYRRRLRIHASKIFERVDINIRLSAKICFSSFHFWKADEIRKGSAMDLRLYLRSCVRDIKTRTFFNSTSPIEKSDGLALISSSTLKAMVSVLSVEIFKPNLVNVAS